MSLCPFPISWWQIRSTNKSHYSSLIPLSWRVSFNHFFISLSQSSYFHICNEDRYIKIFLLSIFIQVTVAEWVRAFFLIQRDRGFEFRQRSIFFFFFLLFFLHLNVLLYYYETFYYLTCTCKQIRRLCY
jgi:hypothetical protein